MARKLSCVILKLSMAVLFTVWVSVWILKPTKFWKRSWHEAEGWASTTFLGETGLDVVVLCLPILAVVSLGYMYLHLCTKEGRIGRRNSYERLMTTLSNPVVVDSPIGMLSGSELLVAVLFIMFLAWTYYSNIASDFKKLAPYKSLLLNRWQLKLMHMGVRFGSVSEACLAILLLPVLRGMSLFKIFGVQFEASVRYHVWVANAMILFSFLHGSVVMFVWGAKNSFWFEITSWQRIGRVNLAGAISLAVGVIIWITSLPMIRRKHFQLFFTAHHLYMIFILFFLLHAGDRHFYLVCSGVLLFSLDMVLRIVQSRRPIGVISAQILKCKAVELTFPKHPNMKYNPTSTIFLNVPSISKFHWHPFSITSSAETNHDRFSVIIKCQGQWTGSLYNMISLMEAGSNKTKSLSVRVEGPYGPENIQYHLYDSLVLVAGGSGITPLLSIIQTISSRNGKVNMSPIKIHLVYMVQRSEDLAMLSPIVQLLLNNNGKPGLLTVKIFVTRENESRSTPREILHEVSQAKLVIMDPKSCENFLPKPEGLQWIAAIVGLSSLVFLTSLVCLNHVFIHQGKKPETKTPSWVGDLLVVCSFVVTTSCAAVATVLISGFSIKELCGFPHEKVKVEEMHYVEEQGPGKDVEMFFGARPNLIDILAEVANKTVEPRVGVFVCGPESMQRAVASFCKTYSQKVEGKHNTVFTFHAINFFL